jgi:hypothetical protein
MPIPDLILDLILTESIMIPDLIINDLIPIELIQDLIPD